jgi:hypothetical protein
VFCEKGDARLSARTGGHGCAIVEVDGSLDILHVVVLCIGNVCFRQSEPAALPVFDEMALLGEPSLKENQKIRITRGTSSAIMNDTAL